MHPAGVIIQAILCLPPPDATIIRKTSTVNFPALGILIIGSFGLLIAAWRHHHMANSAGNEAQQDRSPTWNIYTEAAIVIMLTFASLFFASQFFTQREHVMFTSALMAMLSILGSHNRLRAAIRDQKISDKARRRVLLNHLFFCCAMGCFVGGILVLIFNR